MDRYVQLGRTYRFFDFLRIPLQIAPIESICSIILQIISGLLPAAQALVIARFIDTAMEIFNGSDSYPILYLSLGLLLVIISFSGLYDKCNSILNLRINMKLTVTYRSEIVEKRAKLDYAHIENNDSWELINRVCKDPVDKLQQGFDNLIHSVKIFLRIVSTLVILLTQVWWAGILILAISIPLFILAFKAGKATYEAQKEAMKFARRADYLRKVLQERDNIEERALFGYSHVLNEKWHETYEQSRIINRNTDIKFFVRMKSASIITAVLSILIIAILLIPLSRHQISIGMFTGLATSTMSLIQMLSWDLNRTIQNLTAAREYLRDLTAFCALSETDGALDLPAANPIEFESIDFCNVCFRYPGTDKYILKDFNLHLDKNLHYAVVGVNGAGKTTLTKLLTGLYDNFEGEILINGKSIHQYTQAELKSLFSVVYQDFARYSISMRENIALGNANSHDDVQIEAAAITAGLADTIAEMENGIDTPLGKLLDNSTDLSGGQWQRVAIARALYNPAKVRILDEPTAALDPVAESAVYEMFGRISLGKSTIFITHRLGAARLADIILVIDDGKIAEQGSHEQLMAKNGTYAQMFEAQRSWYQ